KSTMEYTSWSFSTSSGNCPTLTLNAGENGCPAGATCNGVSGCCITDDVDDVTAQANCPSGSTCKGEGYDLSQEDINTVRQAYDLALDDSADSGADFGQVLAAGDFDGDGYDDLAIGAPSRTYDGKDVGRVYLYKGSWGLHVATSSGPGSGHW